MKNLAIVIPAYKDTFLSETLSSLANQTNKNFVVYIGDDNSPYPIESVLTLYQDKLHIVYHRFDTNVGGKSLVQQWYRCVELTTEDYIWLFSDDDILPYDAVERFWNFEKQNEFDICRLPLELIDKEGKTIARLEDYPWHISSSDYLKKRLLREFLSSASEYIFTRKRYEACGFVEFPLAWCSDDASWASMGKEKGIYTIPGLPVRLRMSGENISAKVDNIAIKFAADKLFVEWISAHFPFMEEKYYYQYLRSKLSEYHDISFFQRLNTIVSMDKITIWHRLLLVCNNSYLYKVVKYV